MENARTGPDGKNYLVDYYNFYVVIAVGYRVKSPNTTVFRKWTKMSLKNMYYHLKQVQMQEINVLENKKWLLH